MKRLALFACSLGLASALSGCCCLSKLHGGCGYGGGGGCAPCGQVGYQSPVQPAYVSNPSPVNYAGPVASLPVGGCATGNCSTGACSSCGY